MSYGGQEYIALTVLRATVKAINRICAHADSFRSKFLRSMVFEARHVLEAAVVEIESYYPEQLAAEVKGENEQHSEADLTRVIRIQMADRPDARPGPTLEEFRVSGAAMQIPHVTEPWRHKKRQHRMPPRHCKWCGRPGYTPGILKHEKSCPYRGKRVTV